MPVISYLATYPVKSLKGIQLNAATLTPQGLAFDRRWMIIDENNRFVTQRKYSQMVLIHTEINQQRLVLSRPDSGLPPIELAIQGTAAGDPFDAIIWKDTCRVVAENDAVNDWITRAIGSPRPLRLIRLQDGKQRPQSKPDLMGADIHTHFADAAPFLVCNEASLDAVNDKLRESGLGPVTMERFRPNIVIRGLEAFAEHGTKGISHGDYQLDFSYPCQRCVMPTIDPARGVRDASNQPFSLLADINAMPDNPKAPAFGENAVLGRGNSGTIRVGDLVDAI